MTIVTHVYCQILIHTFNILYHSSQNCNIITFNNVVVIYCYYLHLSVCVSLSLSLIVSCGLLLIYYADLFCTTSIARLSVLEEGSLLSCSS